jgi:hypothetical protein
MRVGRTLAVVGLIAWSFGHPALAAWSGFEQPAGGLCSFGSPLRERFAALVITGRFELGSGRANPNYSLVFTANDGSPEMTTLDMAVDGQEIAQFDVVSHVPAASGASAVVSLNTDTLSTLFHATDTSRVLHVLVPSVRPSYDFDLTGFGTAADVFAGCMLLLNAQSQTQQR